MTIIKRISIGLSGAVLLGSLATSSVMAADIEVTGNGSKSTNTVWVSDHCATLVGQSNKTNVVTVVDSSASTGNNEAKNNTGGSTTVNTGDATSVVTTTVTGGDNNALGNGCCGCDEAASVVISDNGNRSYNRVSDSHFTVVAVGQKSKVDVTTVVGSSAKTGKNTAKGNTKGSSTITTGNSKSVVKTTVTGGTNNVLIP